MIMKKTHSIMQTRVIPRGMLPLDNGEAAPAGTASLALNVREREEALQVTGMPAATGEIGAGERLLLMSGSHHVTSCAGVVKIDGSEVAVIEGQIRGAHAIGPVIVIVADRGLTYLMWDGITWVTLDPADAVPQLTLTANTSTTSAAIESYTFAAPYSQWRAPLSAVDEAALGQSLRGVWRGLNDDCRAEGRHTAPMLVRWAVRLKDGTYLWMSEPQRIGDETLANVQRIMATVTTSNGGFTGIEATTLPFVSYGLNIAVTRDMAAEWLPLVAAIDVFVTEEAQLLSASRSLDYRCLTRTSGGREYLLEMGLSRRSADAIAAQLAASSWRLIASAPAASHLSGQDFVAPLQPVTMTRGQCLSVGSMLHLEGVKCSTSAGGRLYCCTAGGEVIESAPGNAMVEFQRRSVLGALPLALTVVTRPLYSGGFGRYPVYIFTDDGIYAIPQTPGGTLGEARLVDRTVAAADVEPVEAGRDIWFVSRHRHLCRLSGSQVTVVERDVDYKELAWCNAHNELWLLPEQGDPVVVMPSGAMSRRTVEADQLYSDALHAVAVTAAGVVLDLEQECGATMSVAWHSQPVGLDGLMGSRIRRVVWQVRGDDVNLTLKVTGQRGIMAQDQDVCVMVVNGPVDQPLASATMVLPARTFRLTATGEAVSGTLLLPCLLFTQKLGRHESHII